MKKTIDKVVIDNTANYAFMDDFYIGVSVDENGNEGLIAVVRKDPMAGAVCNPMIGGTPQDQKCILDTAQEIAENIGKTVRVVRFSKRELIKEFKP